MVESDFNADSSFPNLRARQLGVVSTSEAVVNFITDRIKAGELKPGDLLPSEKMLQKQLGVSRFALREGLARLSALGIINVIRGKGSIITEQMDSNSLRNVFLPFHLHSPSKKQEDLLESRIILEGELAALAAKRRTSEHLEALRKNVDRTREVNATVEGFSQLDWEFHKIIAVAANNLFLQQMHTVISDQMQPILVKHAEQEDQRSTIVENHDNVLKAIEAQDAEKAKELAVENLKAFQKDY